MTIGKSLAQYIYFFKLHPCCIDQQPVELIAGGSKVFTLGRSFQCRAGIKEGGRRLESHASPFALCFFSFSLPFSNRARAKNRALSLSAVLKQLGWRELVDLGEAGICFMVQARSLWLEF